MGSEGHVHQSGDEVGPDEVDADLYREIVEEGPDAMLVVHRRTGEILFVNAHAEAIFDRRRADLLGMSVDELLPERFRVAHRAQRARYDEAPARREMAASPVLLAHRSDGSEVPVEVGLSPMQHGDVPMVVVVVRDVSRWRDIAERMRVQATALEATDEGVLITDRRGTITWVNPAFTRLTGYEAEEVVGENARILKSGEHEEGFYRSMWETITAGRTWRGVLVNRRKDGTLYDEEQTITPVLEDGGEILHFVAIKHDVTGREEMEKELLHLANHDPLTGLYNRRRFLEELEREITRIERYGGQGAVFWIDLDRFKKINDQHGHAAGDAALVAVATLLTENLRAADFVARFGGDEFAVLLTSCDLAGAAQAAEKLQRELRGLSIEVEGASLRVGASIGVSVFPGHGRTPEQLLARADRAMYSAKAHGTGRFRVFEGADEY